VFGPRTLRQPNHLIYVSTLHDVKGLEFRTLHLLSMEHISKLYDDKNEFVYRRSRALRLSVGLLIWFASGVLEQSASGRVRAIRCPSAERFSRRQ